MAEFEQEFTKTMETINRRTAVCTLSGGLDSTVAAAMMIEAGFDTHFIFFNWGQKTLEKELDCAQKVAAHYNSELTVIDVPLLKQLPGISLTNEETQTVAINEYVPNRNAIFEAQAVAFAEYLRAGAVSVGSTGGDHICPDNSPEFVEAMQHLIDQGTMLKPPIKIVAPLMNTDKIGAVAIGTRLNVPFDLTWSCHNNTDAACGLCSNCESRIEAFQLNSMVDPIPYAK